MDADGLNREIQIVTNAMTQSLRNPTQKMFCLRAITATIHIVYQGKANQRMNKQLRSEQHDFFNTITSFVTTRRSEAETRALVEHLSRCNCNRIGPLFEILHGVSLYGSEADSLFLALENQIFRILTNIISNLPKDRLDKSVSGTPNSCWPTKVSQLMPNGESTTVDVFTAHAMKGGLVHSLTTLSLYFRYITSTLEYAIEQGNCYSAISYNLKIAVDHFESASAKDFSGPIHAEHITRIMGVYNYLEGIDIVFKSGQLGRDQLNRLKHVLQTNARSSYEKVFRLLDIFGSSSLRPLIEPEGIYAAQHLAATLWSQIPLPDIRALRIMPHPLDSHLEIITRNGPDPYMFLYGVIEHYLERKDCSNPDCSANQRDEKRAFSYCSGCRCMKYCSKECQKTCWTLSYAPHKKICKPLGPLRQMVVDAEKKAVKTNRVDDSLKVKIFKDKAKAEGVSQAMAKEIYEEMRKVAENDNKKIRIQTEYLPTATELTNNSYF